jgi:hypothetical protein
MNGQKSNSKLGGVAALVLAVVAMLGSGVRASADGGDRHRTSDEAIVGFWQVTFKDATNGQVVSYVWDAWHSDRTEIQNDSGRTIAGNVCQGAWAPLGNRTYGLTHPAFIFSDPAHPEFGWTEDNEGDFVNASCVILERVTVDDSGSNYAGTGLIKCVASVDPYDPTAQVLSTQNLTITGKRVTVEVSQLPPA